MGLACAPPALLRLSEPLAGIAPAAAACFSQLATVLFAAAGDGRRAPHTIGWRGFIPLAAFRICSNILEQVVGKEHPLQRNKGNGIEQWYWYQTRTVVLVSVPMFKTRHRLVALKYGNTDFL